MKQGQTTDLPVALLFDVYGTLAEIGDRRAPFRQLLRIGERMGRPLHANDAAAIMSAPLTLHGAASSLGIPLTDRELVRLEEDLAAEIASVRLFPETLTVLRDLRQRGFRLGLCSNLAAAYGPPVAALLASLLDVSVWSYEAGAIKPDPAIYARACALLACAPGQVLMVGDTMEADVAGPHAFGMQALLLDRQGRHGSSAALRSLEGLQTFLITGEE